MSQTRHQPSSGGTQSRVESLSPERAEAISGILRLRAEDAPPATNDGHADADAGPSRRIRWSEDVVDNEGMGKKSSKVCCIYHKPRPIGESSSEESSSDSSSSDSDSDSDSCGGNRGQKDTSAQPASRGRSTCSHDHRKGHTKRRRPSPNAYEKMPKPKGR